MKKMIALTIAIIMCFAIFAGCAQAPAGENPSESPTTEASKEVAEAKPAGGDDDVFTIGCIMMNLTHPFYVNAMEAGNEAAADFGAECIWKGADSKLEEQIALIENFVQQGVDAIFIDPLDAEGIIPAMEAANEAGVMCVSFGNFVDADFVKCVIYDDYENTLKMGEIVGAYLDGKGTVANFIGAPGNFVSDNRDAGFTEGIKKYPDINLLPAQPANWDPATGNQQMAALLAANEIDAAFCMTDAVSYAILESIDASGQETKMFSYDGDVEASEMVKDGRIMVDVLTGSKRAGYFGVKTITQLLRGEITEQKNYLPSHFIMGDEMRKLCEEKGIAEGMSILTPDEAIAAFDGYREEFGPK